ncbi:SUF system Fe-S cluster assembly protein [Pseudoroseomonas rhizosphaerae]|uniref:SUF system Fe-S cluster assembly protein n=1 Tax=Teichococcus rhizosphaerae TaxID=1335062 RepID=A0A2C7A6M7_9PROT|nr:SUF system Fe-S cluster assembly protein [Pseudoroseomonas rhizosphaerae]PHK93639.1 SUF system Fe-S cluster assembly protein [Pseudoroseomonas rhizosphaerae]
MSDGTPAPEATTAGAHATGAHAAWTPEGETAPRLSEDAVINAIAQVYDPEIPVNIYELGLIYAIELSEAGAVKVEMTLTTPSCPSAQELPGQVEEMVRTVPGVTDVAVEIVWDPPWDPSRMSEDARLALNMY